MPFLQRDRHAHCPATTYRVRCPGIEEIAAGLQHAKFLRGLVGFSAGTGGSVAFSAREGKTRAMSRGLQKVSGHVSPARIIKADLDSSRWLRRRGFLVRSTWTAAVGSP